MPKVTLKSHWTEKLSSASFCVPDLDHVMGALWLITSPWRPWIFSEHKSGVLHLFSSPASSVHIVGLASRAELSVIISCNNSAPLEGAAALAIRVLWAQSYCKHTHLCAFPISFSSLSLFFQDVTLLLWGSVTLVFFQYVTRLCSSGRSSRNHQ